MQKKTMLILNSDKEATANSLILICFLFIHKLPGLGLHLIWLDQVFSVSKDFAEMKNNSFAAACCN